MTWCKPFSITRIQLKLTYVTPLQNVKLAMKWKYSNHFGAAYIQATKLLLKNENSLLSKVWKFKNLFKILKKQFKLRVCSSFDFFKTFGDCVLMSFYSQLNYFYHSTFFILLSPCHASTAHSLIVQEEKLHMSKNMVLSIWDNFGKRI